MNKYEDPRMGSVSFMRLKKYVLAAMPALKEELFNCTSKAAILGIAEKHAVKLDELLDEVRQLTESEQACAEATAEAAAAEKRKLELKAWRLGQAQWPEERSGQPAEQPRISPAHKVERSASSAERMAREVAVAEAARLESLGRALRADARAAEARAAKAEASAQRADLPVQPRPSHASCPHTSSSSQGECLPPGVPEGSLFVPGYGFVSPEEQRAAGQWGPAGHPGALWPW